MAVRSTKIDAHWNYFLSVERDLERLSCFVEFDERNYECFSVEIARLLIAAAAEADVVCKQLCRKLNVSSDATELHEYREPILTAYPLVSRFEVRAPSYGLQLQPWSNWNQANGVPLRWTAYNKIKHNRDTEYHRANLKNVLDAVAGLFVVCVYLYKRRQSLANSYLLRLFYAQATSDSGESRMAATSLASSINWRIANRRLVKDCEG